MNLADLKCKNCGGQLDINMENYEVYCPYCGSKPAMEMDNDEVAEIEKTKRAKEVTKQKESHDQEITKRHQMDNEYAERKDKRNKNISVFKTIILPAIGTILIIALFVQMIKCDQKSHVGKIEVGISSEDLEDYNYLDAQIVLENAGFTNIELVKQDDLIVGIFSKEGDVEYVSIDGDKTFFSSDYFSKDAKVRIVYHTYSGDK